MSDLLPWLVLNGIAAGALWLVYARSPYAGQVRWWLGAVAATWRRSRVQLVPVAAPQPAPAGSAAVAVQGEVIDVGEETA